ncbi:MAG: stage II sporulation protein P [Firmicutes bacterium]|nr:stage II sporulation protein P [Bacillota bacterium]
MGAGLWAAAGAVGLAALLGAFAATPYLRVHQARVPVLDALGRPTAYDERPVPVDTPDLLTVLLVVLDGETRHAGLGPDVPAPFGTVPLPDLRGRAGTITLLGLDRRSGAVRFLHLPPHTAVVLSSGEGEALGQVMAVHSFFELKKCVENLLQVPVLRYAVLAADGVAALVDALGGVSFTAPAYPEQGGTAPPARDTLHLKGEDVLRLLRLRPEDDASDGAVWALREALLSAVLRESAECDWRGKLRAYLCLPAAVKTNISAAELLALRAEWRVRYRGETEHLLLPGHPDSRLWRPDPAELPKTLLRFWPDAAAGDAPPTPTATGPAPSGFGKVRRLTEALAAHLTGVGRQGLWRETYRPFLREGGDRVPVPVVVYHTHTTESFLPELIPDPRERAGHEPGREAFSADPELSVVGIGRALTSALHDLGLDARHRPDVHDFGGWAGRTGAYSRSRVTVLEAIRDLGDPVALVDVHRDAVTGRVGVGERRVATILLVVGRQNPWWQWNYTVARNVHRRLSLVAPGLSRGVRILDGGYNQDLSPLALLVEAGGADSTLEECLAAADILAGVLAEVLAGP